MSGGFESDRRAILRVMVIEGVQICMEGVLLRFYAVVLCMYSEAQGQMDVYKDRERPDRFLI